jgi:hypothetical protein
VYEGYSLLSPASRFEVEAAYSSKSSIFTRISWNMQEIILNRYNAVLGYGQVAQSV